MRIQAPMLLLALLFCSATAWAQSAAHPTKVDAKPVGTMTITLAVPSAKAPNNEKLPSGQASDYIAILITVFNTDNKVDLLVDMPTIKFNCDDDWVDNTPTQTLFDLLTQMALSQALADGYVNCSSSCGAEGKITRVIFPSCVKRLDAGVLTRFVSCIPGNYCSREYVICCPNGVQTPEFVNVRNTSPGCLPDGGGIGCEATCPQQ